MLILELIFPIRWDGPVWSGRRLVEGPRSRQRQPGAVERLSGSIVPEPVLTRLEACYDEMASLAKMRSGVLVWGRIATADVAAFGATPQMEPPLASSKTRHIPFHLEWREGQCLPIRRSLPLRVRSIQRANAHRVVLPATCHAVAKR